MFAVVLDPPEVAIDRQALQLNFGPLTIEQSGLDWGDAAIQAYMADQEVGSSPIDYRLPNRMVTIPLGLGMDDSGGFYEAHDQLTQKVALFQREGGWLKRREGMYADVVNATLTLPDQWGEPGGVQADVKLVLECLPDFYGDEIVLDSISATGITATVLQLSGSQAVIRGDHPGRCRIVVTDTSGNAQAGIFWAFRSRHYDSAATAGLVLAAEDLQLDTATLGTTAGSQNTQVAQDTLGTTSTTPIDLVLHPSGDALTHLGSYRVFMRVQTDTDLFAYLTWSPSTGGGSPIVNATTGTTTAGQFVILDLGIVQIERPPFGTANWSAFVSAFSSSSANISIDYFVLDPLDEFSGEAAAPVVIFANDYFEARTEGSWTNNGSSPFPAVIQGGDLARIPPSGLEGRPVELLAKPTRGEFGQGGAGSDADAGVDTFTAQVIYRPSYLFPA